LAVRSLPKEKASNDILDDKNSYRELIAWQKAMKLVSDVYRTTRTWPADERFGLTSQVRRAAVSIPANIAEGQGRNNPREFAHFLGIAHGSLCETETLLMVAVGEEFVAKSEFGELMQQTTEVGRLIKGLIRYAKGLG
jgi:four helix bundle protein